MISSKHNSLIEIKSQIDRGDGPCLHSCLFFISFGWVGFGSAFGAGGGVGDVLDWENQYTKKVLKEVKL